MVMEEEPSPEFVGREFVRQYYTVLHACPENLHRFYNTDSSFVHGGLEQPGESTRVAKGQAEIHKRIMSLNLRECRAKIRQVDSFETVNGALVIQVIGELGNSGESMRRFVQTFVLVQQSPKSYYVNNDIFRYQDDVFRDEENETTTVQTKAPASKQRAEDAMDSSSTVFAQSNQDHHVPSAGSENYANGTWSENEEKRNVHHQPAQTITTAPAAPFSQQQQRGHVEPQQPMAFDQHNKQRQNQRNERERIAANNAAQHVVSPKAEAEAVAVAVTAPEPAPVAPAKEVNNKTSDHAHEPRSAANSAPVSNKPLTFAAVAGGGRTSPAAPATSSGNTNNRQNHSAMSTKAASKPSAPARDKSPDHSAHGSVSGGDDSDSHQVEVHKAAGGRGGNFRATPSYPNEQQVFVGNLPQDVTDEELQEFMTKFGPVVEVKIVNKQGRQQGGRVTPAFAFVTFENVEAVDKMMASLPINDFRGHMRLNIERKQERERERSSNFYGGGQGGNYRNAQQAGGPAPAGGRGGMRGGMPGRRFPAGPRGGDNRQ